MPSTTLKSKRPPALLPSSGITTSYSPSQGFSTGERRGKRGSATAKLRRLEKQVATTNFTVQGRRQNAQLLLENKQRREHLLPLGQHEIAARVHLYRESTKNILDQGETEKRKWWRAVILERAVAGKRKLTKEEMQALKKRFEEEQVQRAREKIMMGMIGRNECSSSFNTFSFQKGDWGGGGGGGSSGGAGGGVGMRSGENMMARWGSGKGSSPPQTTTTAAAVYPHRVGSGGAAEDQHQQQQVQQHPSSFTTTTSSSKPATSPFTFYSSANAPSLPQSEAGRSGRGNDNYGVSRLMNSSSTTTSFSCSPSTALKTTPSAVFSPSTVEGKPSFSSFSPPIITPQVPSPTTATPLYGGEGGGGGKGLLQRNRRMGGRAGGGGRTMSAGSAFSLSLPPANSILTSAGAAGAAATAASGKATSGSGSTPSPPLLSSSSVLPARPMPPLEKYNLPRPAENDAYREWLNDGCPTCSWDDLLAESVYIPERMVNMFYKAKYSLEGTYSETDLANMVRGKKKYGGGGGRGEQGELGREDGGEEQEEEEQDERAGGGANQWSTQLSENSATMSIFSADKVAR